MLLHPTTPLLAVAVLAALSRPCVAQVPSSQKSAPELIQRARQAVVTVYARGPGGRSQGTGFFVTPDGKVLTNEHVVKEAQSLSVVLPDGTTVASVRLLYANRDWDVAVLSVEPQQAAAYISLSDRLPQPGDRIFIIGSPLGLTQSVSDGIVSAIRELSQDRALVQITAPISRGSSGSPVINEHGQAVGIATFNISTGQNLNFAISTLAISRILGATASVVSSPEAVPLSTPSDSGLRETLAKLRENPLDPEIYRSLAKTFERCNRLDRAIESLHICLALNPASASDYRYLADLYQKAGRRRDAVSAIENGIQNNPHDMSLKYRLAFILLSSEKLEDLVRAAEVYREIIRQKNDPNAHSGLAAALRKLGRTSDAAQVYKRLIETDPNSRNAYYELSVLLENREAQRVFSDYAVRFPEIAYIKYILGKLLVNGGNKPEAIRIYDQLRKQDEHLAAALFVIIFPE